MDTKPETVEDFSRRIDKEKEERIKKGRWGAWYLTKDRQYLVINREYPYRIELRRIKEEGMLEWFAHMKEKGWMQRGDLEDLIHCFDDLCGCGWLWDAVNAQKELWKKEEERKKKEKEWKEEGRKWDEKMRRRIENESKAEQGKGKKDFL